MALRSDYDSRWAIEWQKHTQKYDQFAILKSYYHALRKLAQSIDIVSPDVSLEKYKLVVAPDLYLIPKGARRAPAGIREEWVEILCWGRGPA